MIDFKTAQVRRHQQNLERYCRLLATELTNLQRQYLHKRIAEEYAQLKRLEKAAFRATAWQDHTPCRADGEFVWAREGERKSGFEVGNEAGNPSRRGRVAVGIALLTDPQVFWLHFGDVQIGPENAGGPCVRSRTS
jgi:hypothetical protein